MARTTTTTAPRQGLLTRAGRALRMLGAARRAARALRRREIELLILANLDTRELTSLGISEAVREAEISRLRAAG